MSDNIMRTVDNLCYFETGTDQRCDSYDEGQGQGLLRRVNSDMESFA